MTEVLTAPTGRRLPFEIMPRDQLIEYVYLLREVQFADNTISYEIARQGKNKSELYSPEVESKLESHYRERGSRIGRLLRFEQEQQVNVITKTIIATPHEVFWSGSRNLVRFEIPQRDGNPVKTNSFLHNIRIPGEVNSSLEAVKLMSSGQKIAKEPIYRALMRTIDEVESEEAHQNPHELYIPTMRILQILHDSPKLPIDDMRVTFLQGKARKKDALKIRLNLEGKQHTVQALLPFEDSVYKPLRELLIGHYFAHRQ